MFKLDLSKSKFDLRLEVQVREAPTWTARLRVTVLGILRTRTRDEFEIQARGICSTLTADFEPPVGQIRGGGASSGPVDGRV